MEFTSDHREVLDKTPVEVPLGYTAPETMEQMIARLVRVESARAEQEGMETFEEADDLDMDDDDGSGFISPYEMHPMQEEFFHEEKSEEKPETEPDQKTVADNKEPLQTDTDTAPKTNGGKKPAQ